MLRAPRPLRLARKRVRRAVAPLRDRLTGATSGSDERAYLTACRRAAADPAALATFKRDPAYTRVLEHVTCEFGQAYLDLLVERDPWLVERLDTFRRNDEIGSPRVCDFGEHGTISPTTIRYVKVAGDLVRLFGPLDGLRIVEIGAGYGGQCFVISTVAKPASYALVDLEPCLALQRRYLDALGAEARLLRPEDVPADGEYDLVISNYAFSECTGAVQRDYLDRILRRSSRGYVTMNWRTPPHYRSLTHEDLAGALPGARWLPEEPLTAPENDLLVWGATTR